MTVNIVDTLLLLLSLLLSLLLLLSSSKYAPPSNDQNYPPPSLKPRIVTVHEDLENAAALVLRRFYPDQTGAPSLPHLENLARP